MTTPHIATENIVCPWCGYKYKYKEAWKFLIHESGHSLENRCIGCKKGFSVKREVKVTYTTKKVEEG